MDRSLSRTTAQRVLTLAFAVLLGAGVLPSQEPQQPGEPVFRAETALIEIEVRATDRRRALVTDLGKQDFTIFENGEAQKIATFDFIPALPASGRAGAGQRPPAASTSRNGSASSPDSHQEETFIYIASRVGELQRRDTYRAIKDFIEINLRPGVRVSLGGLPFTSDKQRLLGSLDKMLHGGGGDGIPSFVHLPTASADEQIANITAYTGVTKAAYIATPSSRAHMHRVHLERVLIEGYTSLVNQLGVYPGKKILVLFSRGLRFDGENAPYMDRFAAAAMRARVTLHAVDVRGLVAMVSGGGANESALSVETNIKDGMPFPPIPELADKPFSLDDLRFSQQGLMSLAEMTGGRAVVNNNDLGSVFANVNQDLGGYYVLGYYPRDKTQRGRFRKVTVETGRPGVRLSFRRGYFESKEFSKLTGSEKRRALERLVYSNSMPSEIPLRIGYEFFQGKDGPTVAYCVGIESRSVPARQTKKGFEIDLVMVARVESTDSDRLPVTDEQSLHFVFKPEEFRHMQADPTAVLQFPSALDLPSGRYRWRVIVRDEGNGEAGAHLSTVQVPSFSDRASPSSLLLTGRLIMTSSSTEGDNPSDERRGIDIGQMRFYPHPTRVFRLGGTIYIVYDLYNVPQNLLSSPLGPRAFLLHEKEPIEAPPFRNYEVFPSTERKELRYVAILETDSLKPGSYTLAIALPDGRNAIQRKFDLVN